VVVVDIFVYVLYLLGFILFFLMVVVPLGRMACYDIKSIIYWHRTSGVMNGADSDSNYTVTTDNKDGTTYWKLNGLLHREYGPAEVWKNGSAFWYLNGAVHRADGPAEEWADGTRRWFLHGKKHRADGPAIEYADGSKIWWLNGLLHRENGPAHEDRNGSKSWWKNGDRHRIDGPAVITMDGDQEWYLYGKLVWFPNNFSSMEDWFRYLNDNEDQTYQLIHDIKGIIEIIKNPSAKQTRVHQMAHVL